MAGVLKSKCLIMVSCLAKPFIPGGRAQQTRLVLYGYFAILVSVFVICPYGLLRMTW